MTKEITQMPKEITQMPKEIIQMPKEITQMPKEITQMPNLRVNRHMDVVAHVHCPMSIANPLIFYKIIYVPNVQTI